jgi:hypothetical protein
VKTKGKSASKEKKKKAKEKPFWPSKGPMKMK